MRWAPTLVVLASLVPACSVALCTAVAWGQPPLTSLHDNTPRPVAGGLAALHGGRSPSASLTLNVDLATREPAQLEELIRAASTPGSPSYGHYLTPEQYDARFAPTASELHAVETWLRGLGLHVAKSSPDNSLVEVNGSTAAVERAFGVTIDNYAFQGREFYANDRSPSVPTSLHVDWIGGLSDYNSFHFDSVDHCVNSKSEPVFCGYFGTDFRTAYNLSGNGEGQTIGFTLWGKTVPQSDYTKYATDTGTTALTIGGAGANGLEFIQVGGSSTINGKDEVALDTEIAHAVAPGIHETYWLGATNTEPTLETVLDDAANSKIPVISNSWGFACSSVPGGFEKILQAGVSTGKTFYFSSGDNGAEGGTDCLGLSPNVTDIGGTELHVGPNSEWKSENALLDDGGCSNSQTRPAWQTGVGSPLEWPSASCSGRAIPDVSADSCYGGRGSAKGETFGSECGAFLLVEGSIYESGGTSLAAPIWAGASAVWDNANKTAGRPGIGFVAPLLYSLGNDSTTYASDFHDIQTGSNGFAATKGWDEATGWGSPNFNDLANNPADINYTGPTSAVEGQSPVLSAALYDHGTVHGLEGRKIKFAVGAESCEATTTASGVASCSVTLHDSAGSYSVSARFEGDPAYAAASTSQAFTVESASQPSVSKIEPKEGPEAGATPVTITGANLSGAKEVRFGSTPAKGFKVESASVISAESPAGKGTVGVTVTTAAGTSATGPADEFSYLAPPSATTLGATDITSAGASLNGNVNPNGSEVTECMFEYGTTMLLGSTTACTKAPGSGTSTVEVTAPVTGLEANTPYYFRLVARNAGGVGSGLEEHFTTSGTASPPEFGRCLKVAAEKEAGKTVYHGAFTTVTCLAESATHSGKYEWHPGVVQAGFTTAIKPTTTAMLQTVNKVKVTCTGESSSGTIASANSVGNVEIRFTGCESGTEKCTTSGLGEGELETKKLEGMLGIERVTVEQGKETRHVALDLYPVGKTGPFIEYTCTGSGPTTLAGSILAPVAADAMHTTATLKFTATAGKQKPEQFEGGEQDVLTNALSEQVGLTLGSTQSDEEAVEINAFV